MDGFQPSGFHRKRKKSLDKRQTQKPRLYGGYWEGPALNFNQKRKKKVKVVNGQGRSGGQRARPDFLLV